MAYRLLRQEGRTLNHIRLLRLWLCVGPDHPPAGQWICQPQAKPQPHQADIGASIAGVGTLHAVLASG